MTTWLPVAWVNFRLVGVNTLLTTTVAAGGAILLFSSLSRSWGDWDPGAHAGFWLTLVSIGQAVCVLLMFPSQVRKIVQRDFQTGMMESHRLTPMTGMQVAIGYLCGAAIQPLAFYVVCLLFGVYFSSVYAMSLSAPGAFAALVGSWYVAQLCCLAIGLLLAALSLLAAIASAGKWNLIPIIFVIGIFGGWSIIPFIPGVALLFGVASGSLLVEAAFGRGVSAPPETLLAGVLLQVLFAVVLIGGSAALIRSDRPGLFSVSRSALLTFLWGVALFTGMVYSSARGLFNSERAPLMVETLLSIISLVVVAQFLLYAAAGERVVIDTARYYGVVRKSLGSAVMRATPVLLAAFGTVLLLGLALARQAVAPEVPQRGMEFIAQAGDAIFRPGPMTIIFASLLLGFVFDGSLYYFSIARRWRIFFPLIASFLILRLLPVMIEFAGAIMQETIDQEVPRGGVILASSPFGTLFLALTRASTSTLLIGLAVQFVAAGLAVLLAWSARPSRPRVAVANALPA